MRISNFSPIIGTRIRPTGNHPHLSGLKLSSTNQHDTVSISQSSKNAFQSQTKISSLLDSLLKQKQNVIDSKNRLIERTTEKGQSLSSIKEQLDIFDEQIDTIEKQIAEHIFKEQQKKMGTNQNKQPAAEHQPNTKEDSQNEQLNNLVALSSDMTQLKTVSSVKSKMQGQARILAKEIEQDEARSLSGQKAVAKREQLGKIKDKISEMNNKVGEALKDAGEKIKIMAEHESVASSEKSEETVNEQASTMSTSEDNEVMSPLTNS